MVSTSRRQGVNASAAVKVACLCATTANITLSGEQTVDGISVVTDDRVLVKNQTTSSENGIYIADTSSWNRAPDWDGALDVVEGTLIPVNRGTSNSDTMWRVTTTGTITVGTTSITFEAAVFSDSSSVNFLQAGTGAVSRPVQSKLRESISIEDFLPSGHVTDGSVDYATEIQSAITAASGKELTLSIPVLTTVGLTGVSNASIRGLGRNATIKTATADINLFTFTTNSDISIENIKFEMVVGTNQSFNLCLVFNNCSNVNVYKCEFSGMSGDGVRGTGGTTYLTVEDCYFHDFTGTLQDSTDINFFSSCTFSSAINNKCFGGNWHGIKFQLNSRDNIALGNRVGAHDAYGIICYELTPSESRNQVIGNKIEDIDGAVLSGVSGAGIYILGNGASLVADNTIKNCNINTTTESLTPGGIGVSAATQPISITGNVITGTQWYGIAVFSTTQAVNVTGNTIDESVKTAIYAKNSSYTNISGNTITLSTNNTIRAIYSVDLTTARDQTNITSNLIIGSSLAIEIDNIDNSVIADNTITDCTDRGIVAGNLDGCTITGNVVHESAAECLKLNNAINTEANSNTLQAASGATNSIVTTGTCTGSVITALVRNKNISNGATGCQFIGRGTAAPSGTFQTGDTIYNTAPATATRSMGWVYASAAWRTWGDIT